MSNTIETQAVVVRESSAVGQALGANEILSQVRLIQEVMGKVMQDGTHYGCIPGTGDKKTLLQPGAQKLTMTFRLAPEYELQETNLQNGHKEYRVICTLKSIQTGNFVGQGVGCCSTMESKYRFRGGARKCPQCGKETIIKGKAEYGGGWLCFGKKGGCGAKWEDGAQEIESQGVEKVECDNPADFYNTVLKMAKKRAFVDATITATAASDIFTQDVGDDEANGDAPEPAAKPPASPPKPKTAPSPPQTAKTQPAASQTPPAPSWTKRTPNEQKEHLARLEAWLGQCKTELLKRLEPVLGGLKEYAIKTGMIMENELPAHISLNKMFPSVNWDFTPDQNKAGVKRDFDALTKSVQSWMDGDALPDEDRDQLPGAEVPPPADEWWWDLIIPVPRKGMKRDEYLKAPDTIRSLYDQRHGTDEDAQLARERLFGFVHHYEPKGWVNKQGKQMPASDSDRKFREALDLFGDYVEKTGESCE